MTNSRDLKHGMHAVRFDDGTTNEVAYWRPDQNSSSLFLVLPAMGVRASFYDKFSELLAKKGCMVATMDWRGHGRSSIRASRSQDWGYAQLVVEVAQIAREFKQRFNLKTVNLIGHSMGGQVGHLVASRFPEIIDGVISVAASDPFYRKWQGFNRPGIYLAARVVYPIAILFGHFPGYLFKFARRESRSVIRDWGRAVRTGYFNLTRDNFDYRKAKSYYRGRIFSVGIEDDFFAPIAAINYTLEKFPIAQKDDMILMSKKQANGTVLNHFNWARHPQHIIDVIVDVFAVRE